ncbi:MAG: N-acetylmuramoyl-L-alanine amidase, partial [Panacagrimonas sp.]
LSCVTQGFAADLKDLRLWASDEGTRVVFDFKDAPTHQVFTLENPSRIVVDLPGVPRSGVRVANRATGVGPVQRVRSGPRGDGIRVVLDMHEAVEPRTFLLEPSADSGHRLVLDLAAAPGTPKGSGGDAIEQLMASRAPAPVVKPAPPKPQTPAAISGPTLPGGSAKPIIVVIDAGHGGKDPGAIGRGGLREKDVALAISKKLAAEINRHPPLKAVLTRDRDVFIPLYERVKRARAAQADLFVSIHANAWKKRSTRGSAVYVLSPRGVSTEHARWLARKENAADLVGGIEIQDKASDLAAVLIDLSQTSTLEASFDIGQRLLGSLGQFNQLQHPRVQQAGFVVLKAPDIPSVLVETAFITNPKEEKLLGSSWGQSKIAKQLVKGIRGYFDHYRPRGEYVTANLKLER